MQIYLSTIKIATFHNFLTYCTLPFSFHTFLAQLALHHQQLSLTTSGILKSIEIKNRLHKRMCCAKDPLHKEKLAIKVKNYRNTIQKLMRQSKANHFNKFFQYKKLNIFKTWKGIREIINISKKRSNNINCIQIGRTTTSNSSDIANEFNRHFTSVAKQIEEKLIKPKHHYSKYLKNPNSNSFFIAPTNNKEVLFHSVQFSMHAEK